MSNRQFPKWLSLVCTLLFLPAVIEGCSSAGGASSTLWLPGPTADPPSEQATACSGHQAEQADKLIVDHRLSAFNAGTVAAQDPRTTTQDLASFLPQMEHLRLEITQASLPRCAHRAQRYVLEYMRARLVQIQAQVGHADPAYISATRQNAEAWDKVMSQELAALVERDTRNSNKP